LCHVFRKIKRMETTPKLQNHKNAQLLKMITPKYTYNIKDYSIKLGLLR
jgi:hypothetical protein